MVLLELFIQKFLLNLLVSHLLFWNLILVCMIFVFRKTKIWGVLLILCRIWHLFILHARFARGGSPLFLLSWRQILLLCYLYWVLFKLFELLWCSPPMAKSVYLIRCVKVVLVDIFTCHGHILRISCPESTLGCIVSVFRSPEHVSIDSIDLKSVLNKLGLGLFLVKKRQLSVGNFDKLSFVIKRHNGLLSVENSMHSFLFLLLSQHLLLREEFFVSARFNLLLYCLVQSFLRLRLNKCWGSWLNWFLLGKAYQKGLFRRWGYDLLLFRQILFAIFTLFLTLLLVKIVAAWKFICTYWLYWWFRWDVLLLMLRKLNFDSVCCPILFLKSQRLS